MRLIVHLRRSVPREEAGRRRVLTRRWYGVTTPGTDVGGSERAEDLRKGDQGAKRRWLTGLKTLRTKDDYTERESDGGVYPDRG
jgi:hypothetical protein